MKRSGTYAVMIIGILLASAFFIGFINEGTDAAETGSEEVRTLWENDVIFEGSDDIVCIDGVAIGELDTSEDGNEMAWVARDGNTYLGYYDDTAGEWTYDDIWNTPGQQLTPAIGDIRPDLPGNEILVVGLSSGTEDVNPGDGTATVLSFDGTQWNDDRAFTFSKLIHGCDIGDIDPTIPGEEGILTCFTDDTTGTGRVYMVWYDQDAEEWNSSLVYHDGHNVRKVVVADLLPEREGLEMVAVSKSGNVTIAYGGKDGWTVDVIYENPDEPHARVAVGDVDPNAPGLEIYTGTDTFKILGFKRNGDEWDMQEIFIDTDKIRGIWVGDVDPNVPGNELYSYGYSTRVVQLTGSFGGGWNSVDVFKDVARAHEMRIGDVDPTHDGLEIAVVGYSQNVTLVYPSGWEARYAFQGTDDVVCIDGVAIGELDSGHDGNEIAWVARDGNTYVGYYDENEGDWTYDDIWNIPGQQLTPAIGDIRPDIPGNEILVVGLSSGTEDVNPGDGTATVLSYDGAQWNDERAFTFPKLIHGADIGDVDPTIPGEEGILTCFTDDTTGTGQVHMIWYDQDAGEWNSSLVYHDGHNVRKVVVADILPERPGLEFVAVSKSGNVTIAYGGKDGWTVDVIYQNPEEPHARVAVGDVDPSVPGLEIFTGTDTFKVLGFKRNGDEWDMQEIFVDTDKFRGVWVGDVDPSKPGNELYSYGYSTRLTQHTGSFDGGWNSVTIFNDVARSHELRIGDVHPADGVELVAVGYSQNVTVVSLREQTAPPAPSLSGDNTVTLQSEGTAKLEIDVDSSIDVSFSVDDVDDVNIKLSSETMFLSGKLTLELEAGIIIEDKSTTFNLKLHHPGGTVSYPISLELEADEVAPSFSQMTLEDGTVLEDGAEVDWNQTLKFVFDEPVTQSSFEDALANGDLKVEWGEEVVDDVMFYRSQDGKTISVDLNEKIITGMATVTLSGLEDEAGNEVQPLSVELSITAPGDDEEESNAAVIIGIIVAALILVLLFGAVIFLMNKGKGDGEEAEEMDMPKEPKQI